ncbi:lysozyme inhibitor LprI family protein [Pigmentiphaga aceris]|nr:lysozyme inhibitor LprI family protein [Pigmentiphaga aceris]
MCADSDMNNQQIYECSRQKIIDADAELNRSYKMLNDSISSGYKADPKLGNELLEHVKKSQRAWITVRDENCAIESFVITPSTPAFAATRNLCLARESFARSRYLKELMF